MLTLLCFPKDMSFANLTENDTGTCHVEPAIPICGTGTQQCSITGPHQRHSRPQLEPPTLPDPGSPAISPSLPSSLPH